MNQQNEFWNADFAGGNTNMGGGDEFAAPDGGLGDGGLGDGLGADAFGAADQAPKPKVGLAFEAPLDAEEQERIAQVELEQKERMRSLLAKEEEEQKEKRSWQDKARKDLEDWYGKRDLDRQAKSKQNKEEEWAYLKTREEHKNSKNPWENIIDNVEINQNKYLGSRDVTRMRAAMLARKADLKKQ